MSKKDISKDYKIKIDSKYEVYEGHQEKDGGIDIGTRVINRDQMKKLSSGKMAQHGINVQKKQNSKTKIQVYEVNLNDQEIERLKQQTGMRSSIRNYNIPDRKKSPNDNKKPSSRQRKAFDTKLISSVMQHSSSGLTPSSKRAQISKQLQKVSSSLSLKNALPPKSFTPKHQSREEESSFKQMHAKKEKIVGKSDDKANDIFVCYNASAFKGGNQRLYKLAMELDMSKVPKDIKLMSIPHSTDDHIKKPKNILSAIPTLQIKSFPANNTSLPPKFQLHEKTISTIRKFECRNSKFPVWSTEQIFSDDLFPPNENSLGFCHFAGQPVEWMQIKRFSPDLILGLKGPAIYGMLAVLRLYGTQFINLLLPNLKINSKGLLKARLFINGVWRYSFVDSYYPAVKKQPILTFSVGKEAWPFLLEKAYVKAYGTYKDYLYADPVLQDVLNQLTGIPNFNLKTIRQSDLKDSIVIAVKNKQPYKVLHVDKRDIEITNGTGQSEMIPMYKAEYFIKAEYHPKAYNSSIQVRPGLRFFSLKVNNPAIVELVQPDRKMFPVKQNYRYSSGEMIIFNERQRYRIDFQSAKRAAVKVTQAGIYTVMITMFSDNNSQLSIYCPARIDICNEDPSQSNIRNAYENHMEHVTKKIGSASYLFNERLQVLVVEVNNKNQHEMDWTSNGLKSLEPKIMGRSSAKLNTNNELTLSLQPTSNSFTILYLQSPITKDSLSKLLS